MTDDEKMAESLGVPIGHLIDGKVVPSAAAMRALSTTIQAAANPREDHP